MKKKSSSKSKEKKSPKKKVSVEKKPKKSSLKKENKKEKSPVKKKSILKKEPEKKTSESSNLVTNNNNPLETLNISNINKENINTNNNINKEKCDGCFLPEALYYCFQCKKQYCGICDNQIHIVPSNRNHERKKLNEISNLRKLCYNHNLPLKYFCENCDEPICEECLIKGPHNNNCHNCLNIYESFRLKLNYLNQIVYKKLKSKYNLIMNQYNILEKISNEVKRNKNNIMVGIKKELNDKIENLNLIEGKKLAELNFNSTSIQKDINIMQELINNIEEYNNCESEEMLNFILKFTKLNEMSENIIAKSLNKNIDIDLNDFPLEDNEKRKIINYYNKLEELNKIKDEIIWKILSEHKYYHDEKEILNKSINEIKEWEKLSNKYAFELNKYNLICYFCGCILNEKTVNLDCEKNIENENEDFLNDNEILYGGLINKEEIIGTKRHYFIPNKQYNNIGNKKNNFSENFDKNDTFNTRYATTYKSDLNEQEYENDNNDNDDNDDNK